MRILLAVALALAAVGAAAAVGSVGPVAARAAGASSSPVGIEIFDCEYVEVIGRAPGALVDPLVPADFTAGAVASVFLGGAYCAATMGAESGRAAFVWADVVVTPMDDALRAPGVSLYLWRIEHLVEDDLYKRAHDLVGADYALVDEIDVVSSVADVHMIAGVGATPHHVRGVLGETVPQAIPGTAYREYGTAPGGYAYLDGVLRSGVGGARTAGVLVASPDTPTARGFGPVLPGTVTLGNDFAITGTTIGFVAR